MPSAVMRREPDLVTQWQQPCAVVSYSLSWSPRGDVGVQTPDGSGPRFADDSVLVGSPELWGSPVAGVDVVSTRIARDAVRVDVSLVRRGRRGTVRDDNAVFCSVLMGDTWAKRHRSRNACVRPVEVADFGSARVQQVTDADRDPGDGRAVQAAGPPWWLVTRVHDLGAALIPSQRYPSARRRSFMSGRLRGTSAGRWNSMGCAARRTGLPGSR